MKKHIKENEHIDFLCKNVNQDTIRELVNHYTTYYTRKANINKLIYYGIRLLEIILPSIASMFIMFKNFDYFSDKEKDIFLFISLLITGSLTIIAGLTELLKSKEKWVRYRYYAEKIKVLSEQLVNNRIDANKFLDDLCNIHITDTEEWKFWRENEDKKKK